MFCFLNSDYVMFLRRESAVCLFISHACGCMTQNLKERILWANITWSAVGKENVPSEKGLLFTLLSLLIFTLYNDTK